jgi:tRNA pseudouridine38-40 synthase
MTSQISIDEKAKLPEWRLPGESLERVRSMFKTYIGYHSYHNFTTGINHGEMKARRYIIDVAVGEPFIRDNLEWARITFHGQSFMLHQIRKMVGLVIMAERIGVGAEIIRQCFEASRVNIPRAPALGLLLDRAIFEQYNERNPDADRIDFLDFEDERGALKENLIYPKIFSEENEFSRYWGWLKCNDDHASDFSFLTLGPNAIVSSMVEDERSTVSAAISADSE